MEDTGKPPSGYRLTSGTDRCDSCFFRRQDGAGCDRFLFGAAEGYRPNWICSDFAPRSCCQDGEGEGEGGMGGETEGRERSDTKAYGQTIRGVEIFRAGTWNGEKYTEADLDAMVQAAGQVGYRPPVKLGHTDAPDAPAFGWVENVRREGDRLVADFADVPDELVAQIKDGRYDAVSAEIYWNLKRNERTYRRALKAVAILGAHPPGVSDLKPLRAALAAHGEAADCRSYVVNREEEKRGMSDPKLQDGGGAQAGKTAMDEQAAKLAELQEQNRRLQEQLERTKAAADANADAALKIRELSERTKSLEEMLAAQREERRQSQIKALVDSCKVPAFRQDLRALADLASAGDEERTVMYQAADDDKARPTPALKVLAALIERINSRVETLFHEQARGSLFTERGDLGDGGDPGQELADKIDAYMAKHPGVAYAQAQQAVLADPANRALKRAYSRA